MIIGISGKKQSGKTTIANYLEEKYDASILCFADAIKDIAKWCFVPIDMNVDMDTEEGKQTMLPCGLTVRELLQTFGTDYFRAIWPDCWLNAYQKNPAILADMVITPDVRFENEVELIQSLGGKVIRLTRSPYNDQHESETALDWLVNETECWLAGYNQSARIDPIKLHFDALIHNEAMDIYTQNIEAERLVERWLSENDSNEQI